MLVLTILVALVFAGLGIVAALSAVQRRLAVRDVVRRRGETTLVVAGSLLGTALITGSFIVGDTLNASIRLTATTQLGPIDETITVPTPRRASAIENAIRDLANPHIDGVASMVVVPASVSSGNQRPAATRAEPNAQLVELDFDEAAAFGDDPAATGIKGDTPAPGRTAITQDLADTLDVGVGDRVTAYLYGSKVQLVVDRILPRLGLAGYWQGTASTSPNAFVAPKTIERLVTDGVPMGAVPPQTTLVISNEGGVEDGARLTSEVTSSIRDDVLGRGSSLRIEPAKRDTLDAAQQQGDSFAELFIAVGSFAIVAGVLLLVNIFVMLTEERKSQLGMLRAMGMRRADLVRMFMIQGGLYAACAGVLGALLGVGVGWGIVKLATPIFGAFGEFAIELRFAMTANSIIRGFCIGVLISLVTVFLTSIRISRINVIRAIRDLPEPKVTRTRKRTMAAGALLAIASTAWFLAGVGDDKAWAAAVLGPPLALWGLVPFAGRVVARRLPVLVASAASLLWGVFGNTLLDGQFFDSGDTFAFVLQGVLLTFSAVVFLSQTQDGLEGGIRRVAARRLSLRLGLAYPLARRFRTALTLGMFALVMFTMVFIADLSEIFSSQAATVTRQASGGFDLLATASQANPPAAKDVAATEGVRHVATVLHGGALFRPRDAAQAEPWPVSGVSDPFLEPGVPALDKRAPGFSSDREVWMALLRDPSTAIVDSFFLSEGGFDVSAVQPGETMTVVDPVSGAAQQRRVIGITAQDIAFSGVMMSRSSVRSILHQRAAASRFYVKVEDSANAADVAARIQGRLVTSGVEAKTFQSMVNDQNRLSLQFLRLMQGYLALGLLVGIAGLGVVMVRAVRERRRQIGVLRALGFVAPQVRRAFLLESGFVAVEGIMVGAVLALVTASQLVANGDFGKGLSFQVPWLQLYLLCGGAAVASLLATAWPAQQASRISPAVALRIAD